MWILCCNYVNYLKPHDPVQLPRVSNYGLKSFLNIFWRSSSILQGRPLGKVLMVTSGVYYQTLTHFTDKYRSHYHTAAEKCGPLLLPFYFLLSKAGPFNSNIRGIIHEFNFGVYHEARQSSQLFSPDRFRYFW